MSPRLTWHNKHREREGALHSLVLISPHLPPPLSVWYFLPSLYCSGSPGYQQAWLRGDPEGPTAHVHEGVRLADKSGWVAIGELLPDETQTAEVFKAIIRAVDNEAATKWTTIIGEENINPANSSYTVGFSVIQVSVSQSLYKAQLFGGLPKYKKTSIF